MVQKADRLLHLLSPFCLRIVRGSILRTSSNLWNTKQRSPGRGPSRSGAYFLSFLSHAGGGQKRLPLDGNSNNLAGGRDASQRRHPWPQQPTHRRGESLKGPESVVNYIQPCANSVSRQKSTTVLQSGLTLHLCGRREGPIGGQPVLDAAVGGRKRE